MRAGLLLVLLTGMAAAAAEDAARVPRGEAQLFIDDAWIAESRGLERTLRMPRKDDGGNVPVIPARPGTGLVAYGTIVRDLLLGRWVLFALEYPSRDLFRYTSSDGMEWVEGDAGEREPVRFAPPLEAGEGARGQRGFDLFSCFYDEDDPTYPFKGWLYYANYGFDREGIYFVRSPDGQSWERGPLVVDAFAGPGDPTARVIEQDGRTLHGPGDVTLFYHDAATDRFLGIFKFFTPTSVPPGNHLRSRAYAFVERLDVPFDARRIEHVELVPPAARAGGGDRPYDEYYASTAWRYESRWLGGLKVWHSRDDYPWSAAGCAFLKLLVSRDGLTWSRVPFRNTEDVAEVFLPNGAEGGSDGRNDGGYISEFSQGPLRLGDELVLYYSASSWGKNAPPNRRLLGGGIFRARLRVDGFVSVDAGTFTTPPFTFEGEALHVNARGSVRISALDEAGGVLGSAEATGDSIDQRIPFGSGSLRALVPSGPIRFRFEIGKEGSLYSFRIR